MRIAYIAVKGMPMSGGIEKYTEELAKKLVARGHEVTVYSTDHYGNRSGVYQNFNIRTVKSMKKKCLEKMSLSLSASILQCFEDYDIVHYHAMGPSIFAFIPRLQGKRVIIQSHGIEYQRAKWGKFASFTLKLMEKISYNMGNELTVVSKPLKKYFFETYGKEPFFIPTAIELPEKQEINQDVLKKCNLSEGGYYFFIARLVEEKGAHYLIDAFKQLITKRKLVIAGALDNNNKYHKRLVEMSKNDSRIQFVGEVTGEKKDTLFRGAYAFCQPSELEGMSIALLEAMSYSKCCIVSDIQENVDIAEGHAFMFKNKDVDDLLSVLRYVEKAEGREVEECGTKAFEYVSKNHTYDVVASEMEKLYCSVID